MLLVSADMYFMFSDSRDDDDDDSNKDNGFLHYCHIFFKRK